MRRRGHGDAGVMESLDSFTDIVTNALGMLVLVATLTVISSRDIRIALGSPIVAEVEEGLQRVCFECRGNTVMPLDDKFADAESERIIDSDAPLRERVQMVGALNDRGLANEWHRFEFKPQMGTRKSDGEVVVFPEVVIKPLEGVHGDAVAELTRSNGILAARLGELDPGKHWLYFVVREDSFEVFRAARKLVKGRGFQIGWTPKSASEDIIFSPVGTGGAQVDN